MLESALIALAIAGINAGAALAVIIRAMKKHKENFVKITLASMVIRYLIVVILVWLCLQVFNLHQLAFGLTFLVSTFALILGEILYINYRPNFLNLQNHLKKEG